jgi:hypothetical protein
MGSILSDAYSAIPLRGVIPIPPASNTAGRSFSKTKCPNGPWTATLSPGRREANARLNEESEVHTAYSRFGRVGEVAIDMGRTSRPPSVFSERKVNCVGLKENPGGFFTMMQWARGVSWREATTVVSSGCPPHPREEALDSTLYHSTRRHCWYILTGFIYTRSHGVSRLLLRGGLANANQ